MKNTKHTKSEGQVVMITVVFFLVISSAVIAGVVLPSTNQIKTVRDLERAKQGYIAADSVNEEAFYRLNNNKSISSSITLPFPTGISVSAVVTDIDSQTKEITTTGTNGETIRYAESQFSQGEGYSFNYGLQVGNGGVSMSNSATINGNVYANGNISGSNSARITGSAVAAAVSNATPEITNGTSTPTGGISLGKSITTVEVAQSFVMSTSTPVLRITANLKKVGNPSNLTMRVMTDSSGSPSNTQKGPNMTISASSIGSSYGLIDVYPSSQISLTNGSTYWLKLIWSGSASTTSYYSVATNTNAYASGLVKTRNSSGTWSAVSPSGQDIYFDIYTGNSSSISGMTITGNANAFSVTNSNITGSLYCQTGSSNNKSCDTSQALPSTLAFSITSANIDDWITAASSGWTRSSSLSMSGHDATTTSGALKISGNLNLSNDAVMTLRGPLYVTGNINLANNGIIKLASSLGASDAYVVVDGSVSTSNSGQFQGSGTSGSYIVVASKNGNFNVANSSGSVVIVTLNGTVNFSNSASAKAVVANQINMSNTSSLNYESGLTDVSFTSGPSGSWTVDSWGEVSQ